MTGAEYRLKYCECYPRGGKPLGAGDHLVISEEEKILRLFIPAQAALRTLFAPNSPPDDLFLTADVRQALLLQHIEEKGLHMLERSFLRAQIRFCKEQEITETKQNCWFHGIATSLGQASLYGGTGLSLIDTLPPRGNRNIPLPNWYLTLGYRVGWSCLPLSTIQLLKKGDLVQITLHQQTLTLKGWRGGKWNFEEMGIVIEDTMKEMEFTRDTPPLQSAAPPSGGGLLPGSLREIELSLEVVLGDAVLPLTQAIELEEGDFVPLTHGGLKATRLQLGNQTIASGELVEVEGKLGVILEQIYYRPDARD